MKAKNTFYLRGLPLLLALSAFPNAWGQTASPVQATVRPLGLSIVAPVQLVGSDSRAATFMSTQFPAIQQLINVRLGETRALGNLDAVSLDPARLTLATASQSRVYFIGETTGNRNALGFNLLNAEKPTPTTALTSSAKLIFPNATSPTNWRHATPGGVRTVASPLLPGDFVDLGRLPAGSVLDFFINTNGAVGGTPVFAAPASRNGDRIPHIVSFAAVNSPFLILAFEDAPRGGDFDYNDLVIALDIGTINVQRLISTPEPRLILLFGLFALGLGRVRLLRWFESLAIYVGQRRLISIAKALQ